VKLAPQTKVPLRTVLEKSPEQAGATFLPRGDVLVVVSQRRWVTPRCRWPWCKGEKAVAKGDALSVHCLEGSGPIPPIRATTMFRRPLELGMLQVVALSFLLIGCGTKKQLLPEDGPPAQPIAVALEAEEQPLAVSPDGQTLATLTEKPAVRLRDLATGRELDAGDAGGWRPRYAVFSADGQRLAIVYMIGRTDRPAFNIQIWDVTPERKLGNARIVEPDLPCRPNNGFHAAFSPDGATLVAGTDREVIYLWETGTGRLIRRFQGGLAASFAPDGKTLIAVTHDGLVRRFDAATSLSLGPDESLPRSEFIYVTRVAFSPDCKRVAVGDRWNVLVKDVESNRALCRLSLPISATPLSFAPDSQTLAVAGKDGTHFFDTTTGKERAWVKCAGEWSKFVGDGKNIACFDTTSVILHETRAVFDRAEKAPEPNRTDPPGVSLTAELIARQDTYTLDLDGDTPEDFSTRMYFGSPFPDSPRVELELRLCNTGKELITLHNPADDPALHLVGAGALNYSLEYRQTGYTEHKPNVSLRPGEIHIIRLSSLGDDTPDRPFWLLPGDYSIAGSYMVGVAPAPPGSEQADDVRYATLRIPPIKVKVVPGKPPPARSANEAEEINRPPAPGTMTVANWEHVRMLLARPISLVRQDELPPWWLLKDVLDYFNDRYDLDIRIDEAAFKKIGKTAIGEQKHQLPALWRVRLLTVLHLLADQIDAKPEVQGDTVWIRPRNKTQSLADCMRPTPRSFKGQLAKPVTLADGIKAGTPLAEALDVCSDRIHVRLILDTRSFERAQFKDIEKRPVKLAPQTEVPLRTVLEKLLEQADATFLPRDDVLVVVPQERK
jgi:WD40 repeat protein